ncbi:MAG: hypothetical protein WCD80_12645 [Desulfobaccales bacterium]
MPLCECGCGGETLGKFCPGHDQKLRARLERMVGGEGLLNLEALVEVACDYANDRIGLKSFGQAVKSIISQCNRINNV